MLFNRFRCGFYLFICWITYYLLIYLITYLTSYLQQLGTNLNRQTKNVIKVNGCRGIHVKYQTRETQQRNNINNNSNNNDERINELKNTVIKKWIDKILIIIINRCIYVFDSYVSTVWHTYLKCFCCCYGTCISLLLLLLKMYLSRWWRNKLSSWMNKMLLQFLGWLFQVKSMY